MDSRTQLAAAALTAALALLGAAPPALADPLAGPVQPVPGLSPAATPIDLDDGEGCPDETAPWMSAEQGPPADAGDEVDDPCVDELGFESWFEGTEEECAETGGSVVEIDEVLHCMTDWLVGCQVEDGPGPGPGTTAIGFVRFLVNWAASGRWKFSSAARSYTKARFRACVKAPAAWRITRGEVIVELWAKRYINGRWMPAEFAAGVVVPLRVVAGGASAVADFTLTLPTHIAGPIKWRMKAVNPSAWGKPIAGSGAERAARFSSQVKAGKWHKKP